MKKFMGNSFKASRKFISDWWKQGKNEKEIKKNRKSQKPPGYYSRLLGRTFFWVLMLFIFLSALSAFSKSNNNQSDQQEVEVNQATLQPAVQYGKEFLYKYLTTSTEEETVLREEKLDPYLVKGLEVANNIALPKTDNNKKIEVTPISVNIHSIKDTGDNTALITYDVSTKTRVDETKTIVEEKDKKKEEKTVTDTNEFDKNFLISVPIFYDNDMYAVYESPKITGEFKDKQLVYKDNEKFTMYKDDEGQLEQFLKNFFESYINEPDEKIEYMTSKNIDLATVDGNFTFESIDNMSLATKKTTNEEGTEVNPEIFAKVQVEVSDEAGVHYTNVYHVTIKKTKDDRYEIIEFEEN